MRQSHIKGLFFFWSWRTKRLKLIDVACRPEYLFCQIPSSSSSAVPLGGPYLPLTIHLDPIFLSLLISPTKEENLNKLSNLL